MLLYTRDLLILNGITTFWRQILNLWAYTLKSNIRGLLEKYPTFGREKETGLLGALDT